MVAPIINNIVVPGNRIIVLLDEDSETTGTIFRATIQGSSYFEPNHVLFVKEMATEVEIDGVEYRAMHVNAVVGIIPT